MSFELFNCRHIVRNFLVWNALQHIAENVSNPFGRVLCLYRNTTPCPESSFKFLGIVNCMERIEALGAPATARLYAEHHFTPAQKEKVSKLLQTFSFLLFYNLGHLRMERIITRLKHHWRIR